MNAHTSRSVATPAWWLFVTACAILAGTLAHAQAPRLEWVQTMGGDLSGSFSSAEGRDIAVDAQGNVFTVGFMADDETVFPDLGRSGFIAKHSPEGELEWLVRYPADMQRVTVDSAGNVYATGLHSSQPFDFDPGPGEWLSNTEGGPGLFIVKFNTLGRFVWVWTPLEFGSPGSPNIVPKLIHADASNAIYFGGVFTGTFDFGPEGGPNRLSNPDNIGSGPEIFVCKIDAQGTTHWARQTVTISNLGAAYMDALHLGEDGGVYVEGGTLLPLAFGTADTDPNFSPTPQEGIYIPPQDTYTLYYKLDPSTGDLLWARPLHESHVAHADGPDGPGFVATIATEGEGRYSFTLGKFNPNGDLYWTWSMPTPTPQAPLFAVYTMDAAGNVYAILKDSNERTIPAGIHTPAFEHQEGTYLLKLNRLGQLEWVHPLRQVSGEFSFQIPFGNAIVADGAGGVYATGSFAETVDFGGLNDLFPVTTGRVDTAFIMKLDENPPAPIPGDINGDESVNAIDVQLVINAALGIALDAGFDGDINGDGLINAVDVQLVITTALGAAIAR